MSHIPAQRRGIRSLNVGLKANRRLGSPEGKADVAGEDTFGCPLGAVALLAVKQHQGGGGGGGHVWGRGATRLIVSIKNEMHWHFWIKFQCGAHTRWLRSRAAALKEKMERQ